MPCARRADLLATAESAGSTLIGGDHAGATEADVVLQCCAQVGHLSLVGVTT